jgi:hypothetical protein
MAGEWSKLACSLADTSSEMASWVQPLEQRRRAQQHLRRTSSKSRHRCHRVVLLLEGSEPMMYDLDLTVVLTAAGIVAPGAVYVWSKDPDRRARAWSLLKLLFER